MSGGKGKLGGDPAKPAKAAKRPKRTVFYRYKDKNRLLYYYYDPVKKTTVWDTPRGAIIKDGKTNKVISHPDKKNSKKGA